MNAPDAREPAAQPDTPALVKYHCQMLAIACLVWVLAFALYEMPSGRVALRIFPDFPLPQTCASQIWFGLNCPGCGLTRSIIHLAEGDWWASWRAHRLGSVIAALITFQIPYRFLAMRRGGRTLIAPRLHGIFAYTLIALLVGNWLVNVAAGQVSWPWGSRVSCPDPGCGGGRAMPESTSSGAAENPLRQALPRSRVPEPCAVVLFGATGDLAHRKLVPALFRLAHGGNLPAESAIVGFARRSWTDADLRAEYEKTLAKTADGDFPEAWAQFANRLVFCSGTFDDPASFQRLKEALDRIDQTHGTRGNRVYYLAVAPEFFAPIIRGLGEAELIYPRQQDTPWSRVVIEKPFGHDLQSARALNREVSAYLDESQVYRIDHYLGKETVQNILALRFGNGIFEPVWNRRHVASVQVTVAEEVGMAGGRGAYYDTAGALRDMVQNHMMQLLCLVAMEPPVDLSADAVRNEKVKVLMALPRWRPDEVFRNVVRAQYLSGSIQGAEASGYHQEKGVAPGSSTETYVAIRLELNNWRWAGVPFFLRTGKRLPKRTTEIALQFRRPPTELFEPDEEGTGGANQLVLRIQPNEGASLAFQAKVPGSRRRLQEVRMDFRYGTAFALPPPEAYERLLLDAMLGDPTLYTRTDEVESAWRFITAIHQAWQEAGAPPPVFYPAGSWGPEAADLLIAADNARWRRL